MPWSRSQPCLTTTESRARTTPRTAPPTRAPTPSPTSGPSTLSASSASTSNGASSYLLVKWSADIRQRISFSLIFNFEKKNYGPSCPWAHLYKATTSIKLFPHTALYNLFKIPSIKRPPLSNDHFFVSQGWSFKTG